MTPMERALEKAGYEVVNFGYPSRRETVAEAGRALADRLAGLEARPDVSRIHFIGHSLGNIVIRWVLAERMQTPFDKLGRVVMLAPPNQGARLADHFAPWLSWLSQPLPDLTTGSDSAARSIPTPQGVQIGIVAGSLDHTVRIDETYLRGQTEQVVVPAGHTFIMRKPLVQRLAIRFLRNGSFAWQADGHAALALE